MLSGFFVERDQILWCKKAKVSKRDKLLIKKSLVEMAETIAKCMEFTKQEQMNNRVAEIRLHLIPHSAQKFYLVIETGTNAWHLFLETNEKIVGEIAREGGPFIRMLKDEDVEAETI